MLIPVAGRPLLLRGARLPSLLKLRRASSSSSPSPPSCHTNQQNVVVALSGGVDSAVATGLLLQQETSAVQLPQLQHHQYQVTQAIHMTNWNADDDDSITSCMEQDWRDALAVARHYDIDICRLSFEQDYWHQVFVPYLEDLSQKGWMGNPDVACNVHVKFGVLRQYVNQQYGADTWLATGHYARLFRRRELEAWMEATSSSSSSGERMDWMWTWGRSSGDNDDLPLLASAVDPSKDQSYFLSGCHAQQLSRVIFPLGDYYKNRRSTDDDDDNDDGRTATVRQLAEGWDLPVAQKRDSTGICFIGKRKGGFRSFLRHYYEAIGPDNVPLVDVDTGQTIGSVDALTAQAMTIGQGAKVSGSIVKYFVVGKSSIGNADSTNSSILVCPGTRHPALYADSIVLASDLSWIMTQEIPEPLLITGHLRVQCRIRNLQPLVEATLSRTGNDDLHNGAFVLWLDRPLRGITPGQRAVFYMQGICLGGATILRAGPSYFDRDLPLPSELHPAGLNDTSVEMRLESAE